MVLDFYTLDLGVTLEQYCSSVTNANCTTQSVRLGNNLGRKIPNTLIYIHGHNRKPNCTLRRVYYGHTTDSFTGWGYICVPSFSSIVPTDIFKKTGRADSLPIVGKLINVKAIISWLREALQYFILSIQDPDIRVLACCTMY